MGRAHASDPRQGHNALHAGAHPLQGATQRAAAQAHKKPPDPQVAFQASGPAQLQPALPPDHPRPIKVVCQDERRCSLFTVRRRRLTACGGQPIGTIHPRFEWCSVSGAGAPTTGEHCLLEVPCLNSTNFQLCLDEFARGFAARLTMLVLAKRGAHPAKRLRIPANVRLVFLPPPVQSSIQWSVSGAT